MKHAAGVAVVAILDRGDVKVDDIAIFQLLIARYAMANLVIDRGTDRFRIGFVA